MTGHFLLLVYKRDENKIYNLLKKEKYETYIKYGSRKLGYI